MYSYRVTKYNPQYRNKNGAYTKEEWTSISEIGKMYGDKLFELEEYLNYENAYISAVLIAMKANNVHSLKIKHFEEHYIESSDMPINDGDMVIDEIKNRKIINCANLEFLIKLILREIVWCKLVSDDVLVHFGYDYYMYIISRKKLDSEAKLISDLGLFVEEFLSPHLELWQ